MFKDRPGKQGKRKIEWSNQQCPVLQLIRKRFIKEQPLKGRAPGGVSARDQRDSESRITLRDGDRFGSAHRIRFRRKMKVAASLVKDFSIPTYESRAKTTPRIRAPECRGGSPAADDDGRWRGSRDPASHEARAPGSQRDWRHGRDDDRRDPAARDGKRRTLKYPVIA